MIRTLVFLSILLSSYYAFAKGNFYEVVGRMYRNGKVVREIRLVAAENQPAYLENHPSSRGEGFKRFKVLVKETSHKRIEDPLSVDVSMEYEESKRKQKGKTHLTVPNGGEALVFGSQNKNKDISDEFRVAVMRQPLRY